MLGRKDYTPKELADAKAMVAGQLAAYQALRKAAGPDKKVGAAFAAFDPLFFNNLALALDRRFVHRIRAVSGKDTNPVTELELISESLLEHDNVFTTNKVIKYVPEQSVVGLHDGDAIELSEQQFEALSAAFFAEIEARFQ